MTKSKRMQPVARVAEDRQRKAATEMVEFKQLLDAQQDKLDELRKYRNEYARHFEQIGRNGMDAGRMADFRGILTRLSEAIVWQEQRLVTLNQDYERLRRSWTDTRSRAAAIDKVIERFRADEQREADRREQGEFDERAQRGRGANDIEG